MATTTGPRAGSQGRDRLGRRGPGGRRVRGHDRAPAPVALPAGREVGDRRVGGRVGRARRREHHGGASAVGGGVDGDPGLAQAPLQGGQQQRVRAEGVGAADVDGGGRRRPRRRRPQAARECPTCCDTRRSAAAARRRTSARDRRHGRRRARPAPGGATARSGRGTPPARRPPPPDASAARAATTPSSSLTVAAARGSFDPCATATSGGWPAADAKVRRGCRIRSCPSRPTGRTAGPRPPRPASCRYGSRSTGTRRRPAG